MKPLDPKLVERYTGVYLLDEEEKLTLKRSGDHLTMQQTGGPCDVLLPMIATEAPTHAPEPQH